MSDRYDNYEPALRSTEDDAVAQAARTMLAALEYLVAECDPNMDEVYNPHAAPLARARRAIAAAKAAGIKENT